MDTKLELYTVAVSGRTQWRVVRLTLDDGLVGVGECSDSGPLDTAIETLERLAPHVKQGALTVPSGHDAVRDWADAGLALLPPTRAARTVLGGVEQTLCDASARGQGLPVWQWLGDDNRSPVPVPCYANINRAPGGRTPADVARAAVAAVESGFPAVKCAPFDVPDKRLPLADAGLARLAAVRAAVNDDVALMVDCHLRLPLDEVVRILPELHRLDVSWLEDAVDIEDIEGLRRLRGLTGITLAGGEFAHDAAQLLPAVDAGLVDVVMPDVKHAGGITRALAMVPDAVQVAPHNPSGPVGTAAGAHLFQVLPNATVLEVATGEVPWRAESIYPPEQLTGGRLTIPDGPGLGITLNDHHPSMRLEWSTTL